MGASAATAAAKAKEAEAAGFDAKDYVVAVVNVDMPPTYGDCGPAPGSPAPSYKSDMAGPVVPGSPAPLTRVWIFLLKRRKKERKLSWSQCMRRRMLLFEQKDQDPPIELCTFWL